MPSIPEYRVRLFLSVDLTGSTAYKHKLGNSLEWVKAFQKFYTEFPQILGKNYSSACEKCDDLHQVEIESGVPKLWKTIGDEILFSCRIFSLCHLATAFNAFVDTLVEFGAATKSQGLNTKGNAWVASFPTPNVSIRAIKTISDASNDAFTGRGDLPTEDNEDEIDKDPSHFDFLGKGIDAGFRISKNSAIDNLTVSPGLGLLLCQAGKNDITRYNKKIWLTEMQTFKGVANDTPYPVLTIDTFRDANHEAIISKQRNFLGRSNSPAFTELEEYLRLYLEFTNIEIPSVKAMYSSAKFEPPEFYRNYRDQWNERKKQLDDEERLMNEASTSNENSLLENCPQQGDAADDLLESTLEALPE